jgi:hypothetical protein
MSDNQNLPNIESPDTADRHPKTDEFDRALGNLKEGFNGMFTLVKKKTDKCAKNLSRNIDLMKKNNTESRSQGHDLRNGTNFWGIGLAALGLLSVFFPWLGISTSTSSMNFGDLSIPSTTASINIAGISTTGGIFAILISIVAVIMVIKLPKYAFICGALNFTIALGYFLNWFIPMPSVSASYSYGGASASVSMDAKFGLYTLLISSIGFSIVTAYKFFHLRDNDLRVTSTDPEPVSIPPTSEGQVEEGNVSSAGDKPMENSIFKSDELFKLLELKKLGVLSEYEFNQEKANLLGTQSTKSPNH